MIWWKEFKVLKEEWQKGERKGRVYIIWID